MDVESNPAAKMRIDSLVSANSVSPASKTAPWLPTEAAHDEQHQPPVSFAVLLLEANRAAREDELLETRRRQQLVQQGLSTASTLPHPAPTSTVLSPSLSLSTPAPNPRPSTNAPTVQSLNKSIFSRGVRIGTIPARGVENLSFSILNRTSGTLKDRCTSTAVSSLHSPSADKENVPSQANVTATAKQPATKPLVAASLVQPSISPQPKLLKLGLGAGLPQQRRHPAPAPGLNGGHPPLVRAQSFPPASSPSTPSKTATTLNARKRSLEASPATAAGARILVQSLPNVKIHVQKKIKLMPKPAGQVKARPEGVKNVLVYHF